jgi:hypothetical protein
MRGSDARQSRLLLGMSILLLVVFLGCGKTPEQPAATEQGAGGGTAAQPAARPAAKPAAPALVVPEGTAIHVRMNQAVGSKLSNTGDTFSAVVDQPVDVNGKVAIPKGAEASGSVAEAAPLGRFKGGARLSIILNSVTINGRDYTIQTSAVSHTLKGKGKRTAVMVGGGAGLGAIIGGLAGGGKGAAIGAAAGAGAGTAGAAFTGNKNIVIPAESMVSFKLVQPLEIK